ncbi:beta-lactamase family protein [Sphingomonas qomolangmaensis]|uniref:Beta-lactamase family protein n=2 Tax=Sphingomonas qomolangmaensis TaxID=2918765 RepID=A0ABY5L7N3_9SPHN|nr:serine hydrolase domain-containing protein [Sphingomonas qomolangmaensis]UUL81814.1 beta-lactamase family protein [Sphingomonas qomolangmaensis]
MTKVKRWMLGSVAMTLVACIGVDGAPPVQAQRQPATAAASSAMPTMAALATRYVAEKKAPGIVLAIGQGDRPTSFTAKGTIAMAPGAEATSRDTLWRVYSMTKPITGIAAMMLVEQGKLKLDQPIGDFIPGFKTMTVLTDPANSLASRPAKTPITVRHLLTHTAGLGYSITTKGPLLKEYERLGLVPFAANRQIEAAVRPVRPTSLREFAERTATLPLIAEPGTVWSYSMSLDVLGAVIEVASGMPFDRFVATRIFQPLGMDSSYFTVPGSEVGRFADNYIWAGDNLIPGDPAARSTFLDPPSFPYGGAGLVMSARDYDRFLHMLQNYGELDGRRLMKRETAMLAMSNLLPKGVNYGSVAGTTGGSAGPTSGYGAGGSVTLADTPGGGPGAGTYGWGGAAGTIAWVDPKNQVRGTVMVNYFPADRWPLRADVVRAAYTDLATSRPRP